MWWLSDWWAYGSSLQNYETYRRRKSCNLLFLRDTTMRRWELTGATNEAVRYDAHEQVLYDSKPATKRAAILWNFKPNWHFIATRKSGSDSEEITTQQRRPITVTIIYAGLRDCVIGMTHLEQKYFDVSTKFSTGRGVERLYYSWCVAVASHYTSSAALTAEHGVLDDGNQAPPLASRANSTVEQETAVVALAAAAAAALGVPHKRVYFVAG